MRANLPLLLKTEDPYFHMISDTSQGFITNGWVLKGNMQALFFQTN
jgi:hypothetical protein